VNELLISDLHLSSGARDAYRFDVFKFVRKLAQEQGINRLWILGDLTDAKDNHSAQLVNRVCDELALLTEAKIGVHIVRGNHDGIDPEWPYFRFLNHMRFIHFYSEACQRTDGTVVLPHVRNVADWGDLDWAKGARRVMAHFTFKGAISESGQELGSAAVPAALRNTTIYSGDVHVPQKIGNVTYVGSPHHVHYGDNFEPRVIHCDGEGNEYSQPVPGMRRLMIDWTPGQPFPCNDVQCQVKVRVHLADSSLHVWQELRAEVAKHCATLKHEVAAIELVREQSTRRMLRNHQLERRAPQDVVDEYVTTHKIEQRTAERARELVQRLKR